MELAVFCLFGFLALGSAVVVVLHRDPVKSTLSLVLTLFSTAVLFVLLGAPFIGVLQVLIYTGAIVVLFLFVVMLLNLQREARRSEPGGGLQKVLAGLGAVVFGAATVVGVWRATAGASTERLSEGFVDLEGFAQDLFARYLLPFEIVGLLLLVAVIGAYIAARRPEPAASALTETERGSAADGGPREREDSP
ncbi:MAG: NADH-quinone oxidoreductase subunit J [Thermoanaerobaculia bacterium]